MSDVRPLRHLAGVRVSNVDKKSVDGQISVRLCNYTDVYYGDRITPDLALMAATATAEQVRAFGLREGDVLITKDSEDASDIGVPAFVAETAADLVCGYHLAVLRPAPAQTDGRYLYWAMLSRPVQDHLSVSATGITRYGLRTDSIAATPIPWWPIDEQRAIANLLDTETTRIDALIAKKRQMVDCLGDRVHAFSVRHVLGDLGAEGPRTQSTSGLYPSVPAGWNETLLRHLGCEVQTGPFGSQLHAEDYVDSGWPVVNPMNIVDGQIVEAPGMTVTEAKREELARHMLRPGDIVVGRRGEMGRAGLVTGTEAGWICGTGSLRLRLVGSYFEPEYLKLLLASPPARSYFELASVGSTMDNLNSEIVLAFPALVPPREVQGDIIKKVRLHADSVAAGQSKLRHQIDLLIEHRQALITAAVTGELAVPGVAA